LPRFQQTRGVLRLLALWTSRAYQQGFKGGHKDPIVGLGTAPLDDDLFRAAVFEQLGESKLDGAVTTDICGKKDSHAVRLDAEAPETPDHPSVTLVVLSPDNSLKEEGATMKFIEQITRDYGSSARTFKSALIFCVPESADALQEHARRLLAWEAIDDENLNLDDSQRQQLQENIKRARRDLRESVWRTYKTIALLGKDNAIRRVDLGLVTSSAANDIVSLITNRLRQDGDLETGISPHFLARNWPPAFTEWSTKRVRDAFYASPQFPRITSPDVLKDTIAAGVANGVFAYVGKGAHGTYKPFVFNHAMMKADVEFSDDVFIISKETAEAYISKRATPAIEGAKAEKHGEEEQPPTLGEKGRKQISGEPQTLKGFTWAGEVPAQKWMNFYTRVLAKFSAAKGMKLTVKVEIAPEGGVSKQKVDETRKALGELGLQQELDFDSTESRE
jgi:hypothetical protein